MKGLGERSSVKCTGEMWPRVPKSNVRNGQKHCISAWDNIVTAVTRTCTVIIVCPALSCLLRTTALKGEKLSKNNFTLYEGFRL